MKILNKFSDAKIFNTILIFSFILIFISLSGCQLDKSETQTTKSKKTETPKQNTGKTLPQSKESTQTETSDQQQNSEKNILMMFHNNKGPMCLEQLEWLNQIKNKHPDLIVREYLMQDQGARELLTEKMADFEKSRGESENFKYLPITFYKNEAFSGFNEKVKSELTKSIQAEN